MKTLFKISAIVVFFNLSQPICDLGIVGIDTLYQIHSFKSDF